MKITFYFRSFLLIFLISSFDVVSQPTLKQQKVIYLLDITLSMWGEAKNAEDIFSDVKSELIKSIHNELDVNTEISLVLFQDEIVETLHVKATEEGKAKLISELNSIDKTGLKSTYTNIYNPWFWVYDNLNEDRINIIYLLTDGVHNDKTRRTEDLYSLVRSWPDLTRGIEAYTFLVELTENAADKELRRTVEATDRAQVISGISFSVIGLSNNEVTINMFDNLEVKLDLVGSGLKEIKDLKVNLSFHHDELVLEKTEYIVSEFPIKLKFRPKYDIVQTRSKMPESSVSSIVVEIEQPRDKAVKLMNNSLLVNFKNKKERVLKLEVSKLE